MKTDQDIQAANEETRQAWNTNAAYWDEKMGEGNDFVNLLEWPAILRLLEPQPGQHILDIATGNGLTARRLAGLGAQVTAFDFSEELIQLAKARSTPGLPIRYLVLDATDASALLASLAGSPHSSFPSALCNMALFDMADIEPLFHVLPRLLEPGGRFVFSLTHPAFNNTSSVHVAEEMDLEGQIVSTYSVKVSRYMTPSQAHGAALQGQPKPQLYFERPLQYYFNLGFRNGFVLDGFEECAFPPGHPQSKPLSWGGNFSEIPPVLVARLRLPA
ncbi:MAG TPA: class I SAM-dependent methyltransferase [Anaerolineales bacterium]|nr:class I SAM-dependent methyltransferase [Anaerolineales bacterium]